MVVAAVIPPHPDPAPEVPELERRVLQLASDGLSVASTAAAMHYSVSYVKGLRAAACRRLGVPGNVPGAVAAALRYGLIR